MERVQDFLDDRIQTAADLGTIDALLEDAYRHQQILQTQLLEVRSSLQDSCAASAEKKQKTLSRMEQFENKQREIDRRLRIVTQSDTSDEAVQRFTDSVAVLRRLDNAQAYLAMLEHIACLIAESKKHWGHSVQASLTPLLKLREVSCMIEERRLEVDGAAAHLAHHANTLYLNAEKELHDVYAREFEALLQSLGWPNVKVERIAEDTEIRWTQSIKTLLDLQKHRIWEWESQSSEELAPLILLPYKILVKPLEMRFRYHFEGDRPTNKIEKPELFLSHFIGLIHAHESFLSCHVQPVVVSYFRSHELRIRSVYVDPISAFITALLPMLKQKVLAIMPEVSEKPPLLSHLVHEIMEFDTNLRDGWSYDAGNINSGWRGLTWDVLVGAGWFDRWLKVEKEFAMARYEVIIESAEAFHIDYEGTHTALTKPTYAAIRVHDLLETVTDRYRPLASFQHKIQFLIDIQISIFDLFHGRLHDSLTAFQALTSTIGRNLQSASLSSSNEVDGLDALERLCRIYGSAEYLEKRMQEWGDDVFFLDLWDELQERARKNARTGGNLAGSMTISHVAERTSATIKSTDDLDSDTGALFDETARAYHNLRIRTEDIMRNRLSRQVRDALRPYSALTFWSHNLSASHNLAPSAELGPLQTLVQKDLSFLQRALSKSALRQISMHVCTTVQTGLWDSVLLRHKFADYGIAQFSEDLMAIKNILANFVGSQGVSISFRKLEQALQLLSLPTTSSRTDAATTGGSFKAPADDDDFAAWEQEEVLPDAAEASEQALFNSGDDPVAEISRTSSAQSSPDTPTSPISTLNEAVKILAQDEQMAQKLLDRLQIDSLSIHEARKVLGRRAAL